MPVLGFSAECVVISVEGKRQRTAFFTGHRSIREAPLLVEQKTVNAVEKLIQNGYLYFGAGGARGFDALASEAVLKLKKQYPQIHLILVLPFDNQYEHERNWSEPEIRQYQRLKLGASKVVVLAPVYRVGIYNRRNRHLANHSSMCIAYMVRENSGTGYTVNYAREQGLPVLNLATL